MTDFHDQYQSGRGTPGRGGPPRQARFETPGKRTLTQDAAPGAAGAGPIAPIQRQGDPQASHPVPDGAFVAQYADYGKDTDLSRANDCGPACVLMAVRAMGAEPNLIAAMPASFKPANALKEMEYIAQLAFGTTDSKTRKPGELQACLIQVLQTLSVPLPPDPRTLFAFFSTDAGSSAYVGENQKAAAAAGGSSTAATTGMAEGPAGQFIVQHCVDGSAVIVMGYAKGGPWGWGPDQDPNHRKGADGKPQVISDQGDHFVFVWRPDQTKDEYVVMDPSWSAPLPVKPLSDVIDFIYARDARLKANGSSVMNIMAVPYAQVAAVVPRVAGNGAGDGVKRTANSREHGGGGISHVTQAKHGAAPGGPVEDAGAGQPLPPRTQTRMEDLFGTNLAGVRVHEGGAAPAVGALAYTQGNDLHFAPGRFQPGTPDGDRLIGHELAHVVQQREGRVAMPSDGTRVVEHAGLEAEADRAGDRVAAGEAVRASAGGADVSPAAAPVQRQGDPPAIAKQLTDLTTQLQTDIAPFLPTATLARTAAAAGDTATLKQELHDDAKLVAQLSAGATDQGVIDAAKVANDAIVAGYQALAVGGADAAARDWTKPGADHGGTVSALQTASGGTTGPKGDDYCGEFAKAEFVGAGLSDFANPNGSHFKSIFNHTDNVEAFFRYLPDKANRNPLFIHPHAHPHDDQTQGWMTVEAYHALRNSKRTVVEPGAVTAAQDRGQLETVMRPGDIVTLYFGTLTTSDPAHADHTAMVRRVIDGKSFETIEGNAYTTDATGKVGHEFAIGTNVWGTDPANKDPSRTFSNGEQHTVAKVFLIGRFSVVDFETDHQYSLTDPTPPGGKPPPAKKTA